MSHPRLRTSARLYPLILVIATAAGAAQAAAGTPAAPRDIPKLVTTICAACHGPTLEGAVGPSLLDATWKHGGDDAHIAKSIRIGFPANGMPPFGGSLSEKEISEVVVYLRELASKAALSRKSPPPPNRKP